MLTTFNHFFSKSRRAADEPSTPILARAFPPAHGASGYQSKRTTIHDVLAEGLPYGQAQRTLKIDHHNFFSCRIFDREGASLGEQAIIEQLSYDSVFDDKGKLLESPEAGEFYSKAKQLVEAAFDDPFEAKRIPIDAQKTPELVNAISKLLMKCAIGHADYYRRICSEILKTISLDKALPNQNTHSSFNEAVRTLQPRLDPLAPPVGITIEQLDKIAYKDHDFPLIGGNAHGKGIAAYHLVMTFLDPTHNPSPMFTHGFPEAYKILREALNPSKNNGDNGPAKVFGFKANKLIPNA